MDYKIEDKQFDFLNKKKFKAPKSFIYRIGINGRRYYYEIDNDQPIIFASGTTLISDGYPDNSKAMEEWRVKMRVLGQNPDEFASYRADYGTVMHVLFGEYLTGKHIPLSNLGKFILNLKDIYISSTRLQELVDRNLDEFKKDLLAFAQWVRDYKVKPLAIELMMRSKKYMVATAIDLVCEMEIEEKGFWGETYKSGAKKGEPKETKRARTVVGIVDFKSGKKGFYPKHALQLLLNKKIVEENYPKIKIEALFNFSPKDWKTTPSYNFTDQSNHSVLNELEEVLTIGKKRHLKKNKDVWVFNGSLNIKDEFDYINNFSKVSLEEFILSRRKNKGNVFEQLIDSENLDTAMKFRHYMQRQRAPYLKDLAKGVGIKYTKKQEFISKLNEKYLSLTNG